MINIRKAGTVELEILQELGRTTFYETYAQSNTESNMQQYLENNFSRVKLSEELTNPDSEFFIAWKDAAAVGYLKVNRGPAQTELKEEGSLEIERIYVLSVYQGKKIGQLLFKHALEVAGKLGKSSVWLGVWEKNPKAIMFYEKNGFVAFGTHIFKMGEDEHTDIMMRRDIIIV